MMGKRKKKKPESYRVRNYRQQSQAAGLIAVQVKVKETDLHIQADRDVRRQAEGIVMQCRFQLEQHIIKFPEFYSSLVPLPKDFSASPLIKEMYDAGRIAEVGPMAAVAGGIAEYVGRKLLAAGVEEVIVENGGDIFFSRRDHSRISIFAGESPLSSKVGIELSPPMPWGICTSSGTIGHSLSMGEADSVTVVARSTYLADAVATRLGNEVGSAANGKESVNRALKVAQEIEGVTGVVVICGELLGAVGDVKLVKLD
jgi:ApbE superfamily uncharacterized protein (UPF0280 family)